MGVDGKNGLKKEKREQAPALQTQLPTRLGVARIRIKSRGFLEFSNDWQDSSWAEEEKGKTEDGR
jgi:hypothetical protein